MIVFKFYKALFMNAAYAMLSADMPAMTKKQLVEGS